MEDFHDQPNGICLECWQKTEEFDKFYKSVQEAHLILLNSKYTKNEIENESTVKCEKISSTHSDAENDVIEETDALLKIHDLDIKDEKGRKTLIFCFKSMHFISFIFQL